MTISVARSKAMRLLKRSRALCALAALLPTVLSAGPAMAQGWPSRPVTVVVPFPAGGGTDTMARIIADRLSNKFRQGFVVDNRPNAGGTIGAGQVAKAAPDGYTLMFGSASQNIILPMLQKVTFDPVNDLVPISIFGTSALILSAKQTAPFSTLAEMIAYAKANPGKLNIASPGTGGSISQLSAAILSKRTGIELVNVPYRGGGPAVTAILAGDVDLYFGNASELLQYGEGGMVKLLAVSTLERLPQLPSLPTVAETLPGFATASWNGFMGPAGLPKEIISRLAQEVAAAARDPDIANRLVTLGIKPVGSTPEEFAAIIARERVLYREAVDAAGLKMQE